MEINYYVANSKVQGHHFRCEVEEDRLRAEARNAAVTSSKASKKKQVVNEREKIVDNSRATGEREWDKGKIKQDSDDWSPPRFPEHHSRDQRRFSSDQKIQKKQEHYKPKSIYVNKNHQNYFQKSRPSGPSCKYQDSSCQGTSGFYSDNIRNTPRPIGRGHRPSRGTYKHFQTSKLDESRKKSLSGEASSRPPNFSRHEVAPITHETKARNDRMWRGDGTTEVQNKKTRVERWLKMINLYIIVAKSDKDNNSNKPKESAGDACSNEAHTSKEHTPLRNSERHEDPKCDQGSLGNYRSQASRTLADERVNVGFDNKCERGMGKNFGDKYSLRRESDISDRTSSMKESDYHDCAMDKFNKASDSKSSNRLGNCQDGDGKHRYVPEAKPFQKQLNIRNWGKDKFYKPRGLISEGASGYQEAVQKSNLDDEYTRNIHQRYPNSYAKDKLNGKNTQKSDSCGYDEQVAGNRPGSRKLDSYSGGTSKCYNWKTESKFVGNSERFEDNSASDNNTRSIHKVKYCKPSPKRNLSNTVHSIETSSASKNIELYSHDDGMWSDCENSDVDVNDSSPIETQIFRRRENYERNYVTREFNSPDDGLWGDCENSGVPWNVDVNDCSPVESRNFRRKKTNEQNYIPKKPADQNYISKRPVERNFIKKKTVQQSYVPEQLNYPNDSLWGDCENSGVAWNVDVNDSSAVEPQNFRRKTNKQNYMPKKRNEQNYFPKKPGKQNYFPKKPGEQSYFPKKPGEQCYVPKGLNCPDDGLWGDCENSGVAWNVYVNNSSPVEPQNFPKRETGEQVYIPKESGEPNYAPEEHCKPNYFPGEPCQPYYFPEEACQPYYFPEEACQPYYFPEEACQPNYFPEEHCQPNYFPEEPCQPNYFPEEPFQT
ncbi:uncharacterized protein TNIN_406601, partial [Trichonephila inaurata madagascariensis]